MRARRNSWAFTLIEVLIVIAVISALGGAGYVVSRGVLQTSEETKLEQDVAQINSAVQLYRLQTTNALSSNAQALLVQLQTRADTASASRTIGLKHSVLDERVEAPQNDPETWQSASEASSSQLRAYWDSSNAVFYTARTGTAGIKKFRFKTGELAASTATETRTPTRLASSSSTWVWDNTNSLADTARYGRTPALGDVNTAESVPVNQGFPGGYWKVGPSGIVPVSYVYREAGYASRLALFSLEGMGPDVYNLDTPEGQKDFLMEALRRIMAGDRAQTIIDVSTDQPISNVTNQLKVVNNKEFVFRPDDTVAAIMIPNDSVQNAWNALNALGTLSPGSTALSSLASGSGTKFPLTSLSRINTTSGTNTNFPFYANQYASLGTGTSAYSVEDTAQAGDMDYQDLVFKASGMSAPDGTVVKTVDPVSYYSNWDNPTTQRVEHLNKLDTAGTNGGMTLRQALTAAGIIP